MHKPHYGSTSSYQHALARRGPGSNATVRRDNEFNLKGVTDREANVVINIDSSIDPREGNCPY